MSEEGRNLHGLQSNTLLKGVSVQMGLPVTPVKDFSQGTKETPGELDSASAAHLGIRV